MSRQRAELRRRKSVFEHLFNCYEQLEEAKPTWRFAGISLPSPIASARDLKADDFR